MVDLAADTAKNACTVIRYMGPDGKAHELQLRNSDVSAFATELELRRTATPKPILTTPSPALSSVAPVGSAK